MKKSIKYIFIFCSKVVFSQNTTVLYDIKKKCEEVSLVAVIDKKYYKNNRQLLNSDSMQGEFIVQINKKIPLPYSFACSKNGGFKQSALFLISKENLKFELDSIGMFTQPLPLKNGSSELIIDQYKFNSAFSGLLNVFYNKKEDNLKLESLLEKYSKENPNSYTLFWTLVQHFQFRGFKEVYLKSFNNLSPKIKNSEYGKMFYNDLMSYLKLSEKTKFPNLKFKGNDLYSSLGKKYTLVDFWYSSCKPCLDIFPIYKDLYTKNKNKGFEIIGISNDRTKDRQKWQKIIADKGLDWKQYLDENGTKTKIYNINKFPTTFLLDSTGVIIKKDISPEELEDFLKKIN